MASITGIKAIKLQIDLPDSWPAAFTAATGKETFETIGGVSDKLEWDKAISPACCKQEETGQRRLKGSRRTLRSYSPNEQEAENKKV